jgi:tripartite-type tricarboxylate transporter receptor subunit TctC
MAIRRAICAAVALATISFVATAVAEPVEDFYRGKNLRMLIGAGIGGGNDTYARLLGRHMMRHLPGNPTFVPQNVPGGAGILAASNLYNVAVRDGSVIAAVNRATGLDPLFTGKDYKFDPRQFNWLGSLNKETNLIVAWHTARVKTAADIFTTEMIVGAAASGADSAVYPRLINTLLGGKFRIVTGYDGEQASLAAEKGEVDGRASMPWTTLKTLHPDWLRDKKINIIVQMALEKDHELPDVPNILEFVKNPEDRDVFEALFSRQEMGRPIVAPPGVPVERVAALRRAIRDTVDDPAFQSEADKAGMDIEFVDGDQIERLIRRAYALPPRVLERIRDSLNAS